MTEQSCLTGAKQSSSFDVAVFIGRFQPPHNGHLAMLRHALSLAPRLVIVLGSAYQPRTPKNPFTWQERREMINSALTPEECARISYLPMRDFYDEVRWVQAVHYGVQLLSETTSAATSPKSEVVLVGHFKDNSSLYLAQFSKWKLENLPRQNPCNASDIREIYFAANDDNDAHMQAMFHEMLPPSVQQWLLLWRKTKSFKDTQFEWQTLRAYKQSWAGAPYEPIFVTVDALVQCQGKVLLVERDRAPGKGLLALPGGFLEPHDTLFQSCLRELDEETNIDCTKEQLEAAFRTSRVFDHPYRSLRGRTITHVFHFDFGHENPPNVKGGDDARSAMWVPIQEISQMPEKFFEDHFFILDIFLQLTHEVDFSR